MSGTGKSTFLLNFILQDIERGAGVCVLDPHGDLVERHILPRIPDHRADDLIYFDPTDEDHPIPFNILYAHSDDEKELLTEDLVAIFRRFSTGWGTQMESILAQSILAILESSKGGHLQDLRDFLLDPEVRAQYLTTVQDREVQYYWEKEFPLLPRNAATPILTRLTSFLRRRRIRNIVCHKESRLDFRDMMDSGKILLVKCAAGALGEDNAYLLGALLVAKLQQTAMTRQELDEHLRRPFYVYIDEFQSFITPSMEVILSAARKWGVGLTLAHQELEQLWSRNREVAASVLSNPYTRICFGVGDRDARHLSEGFSHFETSDLQRLSRGQAIGRVERADFDFNLATLPPPKALDEDQQQARTEMLLARSRAQYGVQLDIFTKADTETSLENTPVQSEPLETDEPVTDAEPRTTSDTTLPLSPDEQALLHFVGTTEDLLPVREVYKQVKLSADKGTRLKQLLLEKELLIEVEVPLRARGRASKLLVLTREGRDAVGLPQLFGKGGPLHQHLQQLIASYAEHQGYTATIEGAGTNGKQVDVSLEKDGKRVAVEISVTTRAEHELENIRADLDGGYVGVLCLFVSPAVCTSVQRLVRDQKDTLGTTNIHCGLVKDYASLIRGGM